MENCRFPVLFGYSISIVIGAQSNNTYRTRNDVSTSFSREKNDITSNAII